MRPLIISDPQRATIKALVERAASNVVPLTKVMELAGMRARDNVMTWDANIDYTVELPHGYHVTYTHEEQPSCVCRHISVSVEDPKPGQGPSPEACEMILQEFGFKNAMGRMPMWITKTDQSFIVEAIEPLDGDLMKIMAPPSQH
jgi:hypothetical protein